MTGVGANGGMAFAYEEAARLCRDEMRRMQQLEDNAAGSIDKNHYFGQSLMAERLADLFRRKADAERALASVITPS